MTTCVSSSWSRTFSSTFISLASSTPQVLVVGIRNGLNLLTWREDSFAYAEGYDGATKKYKALQAGRSVRVTIDNDSLLVKPDVARTDARRSVHYPRAGNVLARRRNLANHHWRGLRT